MQTVHLWASVPATNPANGQNLDGQKKQCFFKTIRPVKSNQQPRNTSTYIIGGYAEIFYQTANADHIAESYRREMPQSGKGRFHDLLFKDISKVLAGNVLFDLVDPATNKYRGLSFHKGNYYVSFLHLQQREDCKGRIFAVILSIYRTYHEKDRKDYEAYLQAIRKAFGKV